MVPEVICAAAGAVAAVPAAAWLNAGSWRHDDEPGRTRIPPAAAVVALAVVAGVIGLRWGTATGWPAAAAAVVVAVAGSCGAVVDQAVRRVPEPLILAAYGTVGALLLLGAAVTGDWAAAGTALACGVIIWVSAFAWALISGMGFADVQLLGLLALTFGWHGWTAGLLVAPVAITVGSLWAVVLLLRGRRGQFAYAPPIMTGALVAVLVLG